MEISGAKLVELGAQHKRELVLRLKKSLYGLKQAGRLWNRLLHRVLTKLVQLSVLQARCERRDAGRRIRGRPACDRHERGACG
ncbi:hypothetical protein PF003_g8924 [Phytophthora fragariae]|nr:hypothetical protein PF003_g29664 [Phytophthora fragariae]KAE8906893.1 hypothetical protein PF003_g8924 [Phytophthora fragariae]